MSAEPSHRPTRRRGLLIFTILALLLLVALGVGMYTMRHAKSVDEVAAEEGAPEMSAMPPAAVYVQPVEAVVAQDEAVVTGSLHAVNRARVAAREAGAVLEVLVDEGDRVEAGAELVKLDPRRLEAQLAEANAFLTAARSLIQQREAEQERARTDLEMKEGLLKDRAISQSEVLDAHREQSVADSRMAAARDAVTEAESRLELLNVRIEELVIRAPFPGVVTERLVEPGEWVNPGQNVTTVATVDPMEAWVKVPQRYLGDVTDVNERVRIVVEGMEPLVPEKLTVVPDVDRRSLLFTTIAVVDNEAGRLASGQSVTAVLPVGAREEHLVFPVSALLRTRAGDFVFVVREQEGQPMPVAERIPVEVAFEREEQVFVRLAAADLRKSERVVVEGNERLQPGQSLMVRDRSSRAVLGDSSAGL